MSEINRDTARNFIRGLGEDQEKAIRRIGRNSYPEPPAYKPGSPALYQPAHLDELSAQSSTIFPYIILYHVISYNIISSYHIMSCHVIYLLSYIVSYHIISYIISYHILYYIISPCPCVSRLLIAGARVRSQSRI